MNDCLGGGNKKGKKTGNKKGKKTKKLDSHCQEYRKKGSKSLKGTIPSCTKFCWQIQKISFEIILLDIVTWILFNALLGTILM